MFRSGMSRAGMVWLVAAALGGAAPARAGSLDGELLNRAPQVLEFLRAKGCRTVGVLKFCVWEGKGEGTEDGTGAVKLDVAQHLRNALILAEDPRKEDEEIKIISDANAVAAGLPGRPNHLTRGGRLKLLAADYPLVWPAGSKAKPDGLLTGNVHFSDDLRTATVVFQYIDKDGGMAGLPSNTSPICADTDGGTLAGLGMSFLLREAEGDDGGLKTVPEGAAAASARAVRQDPQLFPLNKDQKAPVQLEIDYGGRPVDYTVENGRASIPEPKDGEKVSFRLKRAPGTRRAFGVALLVNGENTLFPDKERRSTDYAAYSKWVLRPDRPDPRPITGYQMDDKSDHPFQVRAPRPSGEDEVEYGENLGKITMVVFPEARSGEKDEADPKVTAVKQGELPSDGARTLEAAQNRLRKEGLPTRGIIAPGTEVESSPVEFVDFSAAPKPVMTVVITYYHSK